jgi:hypothetical protein
MKIQWLVSVPLSVKESLMLAVATLLSVCKVVWGVEIKYDRQYGDVLSILVLVPIGALCLFGFRTGYHWSEC